MRVRNHGKYTHMSKSNPRGIARCDYSGFMVKHATMKEQCQYRGQGLVNTGYLVDPKFWDKPNPQDLIPLIKADPVPFLKARPDNYVEVIPDQTITIDVSGNSNYPLSEQEATNINFFFVGVLTGDVTVFISPNNSYLFKPSVFELFVTNNTTGLFNLYMQITNNSASKTLLMPNQTMLLCNDGYTLRIINPN